MNTSKTSPVNAMRTISVSALAGVFCISAALSACSNETDTPQVGQSVSAVVAQTATTAEQFALYARDSLAVDERAIVRGHVGVAAMHAATATSVLDDGVRASIDLWADVGSGDPGDNLIARSAIFRYGSRVGEGFVFSVPFDQKAVGHVTKYEQQGLEFPQTPAFPHMRPVLPGTSAVSVAASGTVNLSGDQQLGTVSVGPNGTLSLTSGDFQVQSVYLAENARITTTGTVALRILERLMVDANAIVGTSTHTASSFRVEVAASNGGQGGPRETPAVSFGNSSRLYGQLLAPSGTIDIGESALVMGSLHGQHIRIRPRAQVNYLGGLARLPGRNPLAYADDYQGLEDHTLTVATPGVLSNDVDPNYVPLSAELVSGAHSGTVAFAATGAFTYTPNPEFSGTDSFTYRATNGVETSSVVTVTLRVFAENDAPEIVSRPTHNAFVGQLWNYQAAVSDPDPFDTHTYALQNAPSGVTIDSSGLVSWVPDLASEGRHVFQLVATDSANASDTQTLDIVVRTAVPIDDFALLARNSIYLAWGSDILEGNLGVTDTSTSNLLGEAQLTAFYGTRVGGLPGSDIFAQSVSVYPTAEVQNIYTNNLIRNEGFVSGGIAPLPSLPAFPTVSASIAVGTSGIRVAAGTTRTISSTQTYSFFDIGSEGCLKLQAGT